MTLKEIESHLIEGDNIVITSGEHYAVACNILIEQNDYVYYEDGGALLNFLTIFGMHNELNNIYIHRVHYDRFVVETFKLDLSESELEEITSVYI